MSKYEKLFEFISYFENADRKNVCHWIGGKEDKDGVFTMPFPIYDKKLESFIDEVSKTDLMDREYMKTLRKYNVIGSSDKIASIEGADFNLLKAILTFYIRAERFCSGVWSSAFHDKVFYKILMRLKQLEI